MLALLQLHLSGSTSLNDCHSTGEFREALLELLAVVVGVSRVDFLADLLDPTSNGVGLSCTLHNRGLVLGDDDLSGASQHVESGVFELQAHFLADDLTTGQHRDVLEHGLAAVSEARSLHGNRLEDATDLVHHEGGKGFALHVLGDDEHLLARLDDLVHHREEVLDRGDLRVDDQDVGVFEDRFLTLGVSHHVAREVALVKAHSFGELQGGAEGVGLFNSHHTFLTDLVNGFGDQVTDGRVSSRNRRGRGNFFLGLDLFCSTQQAVRDGVDGLLNSALQSNWVGTSCDVAQTFANHRLGENHRRGCPVTGDIVSLLGDLFDEFSANLLVGVLELDFFGNRDTIVCDGGGAPLLLEHHVAAAGPQGDLDGIGEDIESALETATGLFIESN